MSDPNIRNLTSAIHHLEAAATESRPIVAYAHRAEALKLVGSAQRTLDGEVRAASETVESHLAEQGVTHLRLADPAVTLYIERRLYAGVDYAEGEDTDAGHSRAAEALREAGLDDFVGTRLNLKGLASHYREMDAEGEVDLGPLEGAIKITTVTRVKTRKAS